MQTETKETTQDSTVAPTEAVTEKTDGLTVAVAGSRAFSDYEYLVQKLDSLRSDTPNIRQIVSGGAMGADRLGVRYAKEHHLLWKEMLPDWKTHGKRAGLLRNHDIVNAADIVVTFWDGKSTGTAHTIDLAKRANKPVFVHSFVPGNTPTLNTVMEEEEDTVMIEDTTSTSESYTPSQAWEPGVVKLFPYNGCKEAKAYARKHKLAVFSCEVSDQSRCMNYVVGPWYAAADMVLRRQLYEARGPSQIMFSNTKALGAAYEGVFKDQQTLPFFDLEFYSDAEHGNGHRHAPNVMDRITRTVARVASGLLLELFPDQVTMAPEAVATGSAVFVPEPDAIEGWPSRMLAATHYYKPWSDPHDTTKPVRAPAQLDPRKHWMVLDACRDSKQSQHLILSPLAGMCWDSMVDQAIFVGLLYRRIYQAAFHSDVAANVKKNAFYEACRSLFVLDKGSDDKLFWTLVVDAVVYKRFQLIRTAFSSKRTQDRPLLYRPDVFVPNKNGVEGTKVYGDAYKGAIVSRTLVGRIPRGDHVQRLSFAQSYPSVFGSNDPLPGCTAAYKLSGWKWVPNYQGRGVLTPPQLIHPKGEPTARGPWRSKMHQKRVDYWLALTNPAATKEDELPEAPNLLDKRGGSRKKGGGKGKQKPKTLLLDWDLETLDYSVDGQEEQAAAETLASYVQQASPLKPWWIKSQSDAARLADMFHINPSRYRNKKTGQCRYKAIAAPNLRYCPIYKQEHDSGAPYLIIDGRNGRVKVQCLAGKCSNKHIYLKQNLLPEQVEAIFPRRFQQSSTTAPATTSKSPNKRARSPPVKPKVEVDAKQPPKKRAKQQ